MRFFRFRILFVPALVCATGALLSASTAAIGMASANGSFQINSSKVWGHTTLFDGYTIETAQAPSELRLNNGAQLRLATGSRATVFQGRAVLEKGSGQVEASPGYLMQAGRLNIQATSADTVARVQLGERNRVMVAALRGAVRVTNGGGMVVAKIGAGHALNLDPEAGAAGPTRVSGCLLRKDGKYIVVDDTTGVTVQVQGAGLEKETGHHVEVTGAADSASPTAAGATQLINVSGVKRTSKGGCDSVAKIAGAAGGAAAGAGGAAAASSATAVAIVGGVAAAATVGGLAAAGTFSGEEARPSASR